MKVADTTDEQDYYHDDVSARKVKPMAKVPKKSKKELEQFSKAFNFLSNKLPEFDEAIKALRFADEVFDAGMTLSDMNDYGGDGEDEVRARNARTQFCIMNGNIAEIIRFLKIIKTEVAYAEFDV
jgi:hypothetical protein